MMERFRGREALILACGVWTVHALLEMSIAEDFLLIALIWAAHGLILMVLMGVLLDRAMRSRSRLLRYGACLVLPVIFALLQTIVDLTTTYWLGDQLLNEVEVPTGMIFNSNDLAFQVSLKLNFKYYIWLFGFYAVTLVLLRAARNAYEARLDAQRAELEALRLQVNPHFLFNALNSISALILQNRHQDADTMTLTLAGFYRNNLAGDGNQMVRLADELDAVQAYVQLEQVRLGDGLELQIERPDGLDDARLPSLLLQPLIENAIKHGGGDPPGAAPVRLAITGAGGRLEITVENRVPEAARDHEGTGTGLANVRRRLQAMFGDAARLEVGEVDGRWRAFVAVPLIRTA